MRTTGMILREERLKKGFTLEQVEKATRIRSKYLEALEAGNYKKLPALPYVQGFLRNYSVFLGLRSTTILAIFRREYTQKERERVAQIEEPLANPGWQITTNKVLAVVIVFIVGSLFIYFFNQYQALHAPPPLTLEQPREDIVTEEEEIPVFGNTDKDATLTINNEPLLVKENGKFYKDIPLSLGQNTLVIEAKSRVGKKTTIMRVVTRSP